MGLLIINLITINFVSAKSYVADDTTILSSNIHDFFNNYFSYDDQYLYFPYECNYDDRIRVCYYGINHENEYVALIYENGGYTYSQVIDVGIDNNFSVTGNNIFYKNVSTGYLIFFAISFIFGFVLIIKLLSHLLPRRLTL